MDEATGGKYRLGYDFNPEAITVNVTIDKLPDGTAAAPVNEVTGFTNKTDLVMVYPQWKDDGSGMVQPSVEVKDKAEAAIEVNPLRLPRISVSKEATDGSSTVQYITLGGTVVYKIGITNTGAMQRIGNECRKIIYAHFRFQFAANQKRPFV